MIIKRKFGSCNYRKIYLKEKNKMAEGYKATAKNSNNSKMISNM